LKVIDTNDDARAGVLVWLLLEPGLLENLYNLFIEALLEVVFSFSSGANLIEYWDVVKDIVGGSQEIVQRSPRPESACLLLRGSESLN
jgi:hypothetical protein